MKKIVSIILAALMLCALCAPAFAEDEPTEVKPKSGRYKVIEITAAGNYIIKGDYSVNNISVGFPDMQDITLTIPKGVTVTVTDGFTNHGTINVCGTLILSGSSSSKNNFGTINIMSCGGGKLEGTFNKPGTVNTYNEHNFENGKCTYCGTYKCEATGNHNFSEGKCTYCGTYECELNGNHTYNSGVCSVCGTKGCEIGQLKHNWVNGVCSVCGIKGCEIGELEHNWVNGVCSVCNTPCEHENWNGNSCAACGIKNCAVGKASHAWDANTGKCTVCEYECRHNDGYTAGKCNICQQECKHGNTFTKTFCSDCGEEVKSTTTAVGSALSEGDMIIICSVATLVIGLCGGFIIGTKKKKKS